MIHISAPGKLMVSGEWAVLEGSKCVVAAVNRRVHSIVDVCDNDISITLDDFCIKNAGFSWDGKNIVPKQQADAEKLKFTKVSIEVSLRFLQEKGFDFKPFAIRTYGEETMVNGKKVGFGSSAAAVVAIIASILNFYGHSPGKEEIYKLATIAHYFAQGKVGSAFDVAASTYGGIIVYRRFDAAWLTKKIEGREKIADIVKEKWLGFFVEHMKIPENLFMAIAWTGESASTSAAIRQMDSFKKSSPGRYKELYDSIGNVVKTLIDALKSEDEEKVIVSIKNNRELLSQLTKESGVNIETPELKLLSDIAEKYGAAGKLSGAGGGDCGFAVSFGKEAIEKVKEAWQKAGLYVIDAYIDKDGVRTEK